MNVFDKGLVTILSCALLFAILAIPLVLRKVPRNSVYGFRTRATLSDDVVWYEANAHFGRGLLVSSAITAIAALVVYNASGLSAQFFLKSSIVVLIAPPLVAALLTSRVVRSLSSGGSDRRPHR